jgi:tetratricopeptide (TPR) repeat protein
MSMAVQSAVAQKGGTSGGSRGSVPSRTPSTPDTSSQPIFISGRVLLDGGGTLSEPVAIERVCNGSARREGYTDFKGHFQLTIGTQNFGFQDASENDPRSLSAAPVRNTGGAASRQAVNLQGCELRAVLAGYQSSSVMLRPNLGDSFQLDVGTIVLKKMGDMKGNAVSVTSMAAPKDARQAFEKGSKAFEADKMAEAQKELEKAVRLYPQYAAAWSRLGDVQHRENNLQDARKSYEKSLEADPQYLNPVYGLTLIAVVEKNWQEVAQRSAQVLGFPNALFFNAAAHYNMGNMEAAEDSARKYKAGGNWHSYPTVCLLLSNILERKQDFAGAAQQIREYLAVAPNAQDAAQLTEDAKRLEQQSLAKKQ